MVTLLHVLSYRFIFVQIILVIGVTVNMWLGSALGNERQTGKFAIRKIWDILYI